MAVGRLAVPTGTRKAEGHVDSTSGRYEAIRAALDARARGLTSIEQIDLVEDGVNGIVRLKAEARAADSGVRWCVASRLGEVNPAFHARDTELLELALSDIDRAVRQEAITVLALLCPDLPARIVGRIIDRVLCDDASVVHEDGRTLLAVLSVTRNADAVTDELLTELTDPDPYRRAGIELRLKALAHFDGTRAAKVIAVGLRDPDDDVRFAVARTLPLAPWGTIEPLVGAALEDPDLGVRRCAFEALLEEHVRREPRHTVASVWGALDTGDDTSRMIAAWALPVLTVHAPAQIAAMYEAALGDRDARVVAAATSGLRATVRRRPAAVKPLIRAALADETAFRVRTFDVALGLVADLHASLGPALFALCATRPSHRLDILVEAGRRLAWAVDNCPRVRSLADRLHMEACAAAAV
ncbi:MAG: hypothetical protein IT198_08100 [Acidimicrobiia bacterium]|nr:hypothetical protein [Acidimicrobiia bacterium]